MSENPPGQARKPMAIPIDMKAFNEKLIADFRATDGRMSGQMAGRSIVLLTTTGAHSGKPRTTVLGFGRSGARLVVLASNNGAPKAPAWYHNLLANPAATVELGPSASRSAPPPPGPEQRDEFAATVPYIAQQQSLTDREIPLVVLERV